MGLNETKKGNCLLVRTYINIVINALNQIVILFNLDYFCKKQPERLTGYNPGCNPGRIVS